MCYSISHNLTNETELSRVIFLSDDQIAYNTYILPREPNCLLLLCIQIFFFLLKRQLLQILRRKYHETPDKHLSKKPSLFKFQTTN